MLPPTVPVPVATHSLVYAAHVLPWVVASAHATPSLFLSILSFNIRVAPSPASISKVAFVMSGSSLNLQLCSTSMLSTTFLLHSLHVGIFPSATADGATHCVSFPFTLISLSMKKLISLWIGKFIDTWSTRSPIVLLTVSLTFLSWKPLYLCCWEIEEHLWCLET